MLQSPPAILGRQARALRLLTFLQAGPGFNAKELAKQLKVSRRTIYRDLNLIREAGVPIYFDSDYDAYRLGTKSKYVEPIFSDEEMECLIVLIRTSVLYSCSYFATAASELITKLLARQGRDQLPAIRLRNAVVSRRSPLQSLQADILRALLQAIADQQVCRLELNRVSVPAPLSGEFVEDSYWTKFAPMRFVFSEERWSVLGRSSVHRERISVDLMHIINLQATDETFTIPRGFRRL